MKKKLTLLFALLCVSVMGWADTELFNAASAEIDHTYFKTYGWADETTPSSATWSDAELAISMTEGKNDQWQAQVFLDTKITFDASKKYTVSFDITTSNGVGGVMVKLCNTGTMYYETITTGAGVPQHYAKENIQGVAGNDGMLIFDFGYAPANTAVTITNISILEQDAPSTPDTYCQKATGHLGNPDFGDPNGRILLTITKLSNSSVGVKVEPNNGGADVFDFVEVILAGVSKTLGTIGGSTPTTAEIVYDGLASLNFNVNVLWHHKTWGDAAGRWTTQSFAVTEAELCPTPPVSEYCLYQDPQTIKGGKNIALTWETVANGNVVITMSNGTGTTSCSFRNGGFEGGIGAFIVSTDDFVTSEAASNYFTATQVYSGNTYTLTKIADLPDNAKIKHVGSGHALAWVLDGNDEYCYPDFIYTYGGICNEEPELTSIEMSSSTAIAQVGAGITITASPLDQFGAPIEATINYEISPSDAGEIVGNVFTFAKLGAATITARSGDVQNSIALYCVSSDNLALNKDCEGGFYDGNPGETAAKANDGAYNTAWVTYANQPASVEWWYVDLGNLYNITAISALWGNDYSTNYILQVRTVAPEEADKADDEAWTTIATVTNASAGNIALNYVTAQGRYVRIHSLNRSGDCIRLRELQVFGSEAVTPTKSVSAAVNDPLMGTATVTQNAEPVTEVTTGSTVTFSATPNDGYVFVNWSNGNTNATFNATVDAAMNLTANFRAQGTVYCNTEVTSTRDYDVHVAYATMKRTSANNYKLVVRSAETLGNFSNTTLQVNGSENLNLNNQGTLTDNNHVLTYEFTSTTPPSMTSGYMYLNVPGSKYTECWFTRLTNIEYEVPCNDENVPVESISLNYMETTIEIGNTKTLVVTFNPVYATDKTITWTSTNSSVASVDNGVVTANATGTATITAETSNGKTATFSVTVEPVTEKTCWGVGNDFTYQGNPVSYDYAITRNTNKTLTYTAEFSRDVTGLGIQVNVHNDAVYSTMSYDSGSKTATFTTTETFNTGNSLHGFFYFGGNRTDYYYTIGEECAKPSVAVTGVTIDRTSATLMIDETVTLSAEVVPANASDKEIVWENSDPSVASFESSTGLVTALAVGTTTITAKSHADESIFATCVVTVSSALTPTTWYGYGSFTPQEGLTGFTYSITRNSNRSLTYTIVLDKDPVGFVGELNIKDDGVYSAMTYTPATRTATFTTDENYALDGDVLNKSFWWLKYNGGVDRVNFSYTVGSENAPLPQAVAVDEEKDNNAILTTYDGQTVIGVLGRTFSAGNLYTLVLPFDVDAAQTAAKLPGHLTKLQNTIVKENQDLRINFVDVTEIEAGVPYLYEPSTAVANPTFESVEVSATLNPTVADSYAKYYGIYAPMDGNDLHALTDAYVLGPDQYLYAVSDLPANQTMAALRAYFVLNFPPSAGAAPRRVAQVVFNSQETEVATGIENAIDNEQNAKILRDGQLLIIREGKMYNAQGQLIK